LTATWSLTKLAGVQRRSKELGLRLLLLLGSLTVCIGLTEIALRIAGVSYPCFFYTVDRWRGGALMPGARGWYRDEGRAFIEINMDGLRDREHAIDKDGDVFRIAVLGDSYAEALQVPLEQTFWSVLGERLKVCRRFVGRDVEVINFGVAGYGTAQELSTLRHYVWKYEPDLVLLAFTTGNDVRNNSRELEPDQGRLFFDLINGELVPDYSFRERIADPQVLASKLRIINRSRLLQTVMRARQLLAQRRHQQALQDTNPSSPADIGLDDQVYLESEDSRWREAWQLSEAIITQTAAEVRQRGAAFLVVVLSNPAQVHPDPTIEQTLLDRLGVEDLFHAERRLTALGAEQGFPVVTLSPEMRQRARDTGTFFHGFGAHLGEGHWNQAGHQLAGELIAAAICTD
jgi:hypothetical protein